MKLLYLLFGFMTLLANAQENFVKINGSTNVNKFQCVNNKFKNDGGVYTISEKNLPNIVLKVADFDCGNRMMTKDFQKILNAEKYPNMTIKFINFVKNQEGFNAIVEVKMMNQSKRYNIEFDIENNKLIGRKNVKFSDFNITPPKKMGGMIVVKDDLDLIFSLATKI
ncbi:YceI family protein [Epilithonimonas caeni]|uniref:YceI family protein n=1 Tax=Epilithonimonas caeni TaxID=365343 RepID=UPI000489451D|nr:YceI family protein [Epilithonimonas caeni]